MPVDRVNAVAYSDRMATETKQIRVDREVLQHIEDHQRPREAYTETLRRLLNIKRERREEPKPAERRRAS